MLYLIKFNFVINNLLQGICFNIKIVKKSVIREMTVLAFYKSLYDDLNQQNPFGYLTRKTL